MASDSQESGGIGGKFRKRPLRRFATTPYDRTTATATRDSGIRTSAHEAARSGWISRLINPASRVIARGASKLFSSMFQKRLTGPPVSPAENTQPCQVPAIVNVVQQQQQRLNINSSIGVAEQRGDGECTRKNSDNVGISELEQLLKQKTFTRVEFGQLSELLRSRTLEFDAKETSVGNALVDARGNLGKVKSNVPSDGVATPSGTASIPEKTIASPSEIAKAYIKSRSSILPVSTLAIHNQMFHEEATPSVTKAPDTLFPSRSLVQFSGSTEHSDNGYFTPQSRGRSAIYKMSRSPYFNLKSSTFSKGGLLQRDGFNGHSTPARWTLTAAGLSGGKQVLKRGRSLLDNDLGYFGPLRRTRQKSDILSPLKGQPVPSSSNFLQKSDKFMPEHGEEDLDTSNAVLPTSDDKDLHIPVQSSVIAQKILQQLDKLAPSQKEKSTELKSIPRDETPIKLAPNMFSGKALASAEDIKPSMFVGIQGGNLNVLADEGSLPNRLQKNDEVQENGHLIFSSSYSKAPLPNGLVDSAILSQDGQTFKSATEIKSSNPIKVFQHGKPSFVISAPEDNVELDEDCSRKKKQELESFEFKPFGSKRTTLDKPFIAPSGNLSNSVSIPFRDFDGQAPEQPASTSSTATVVSGAHAVEPSVPILGLQKSLKQRKEETPSYTFGSKGSLSVPFSAFASEASVQNNRGELFQEPGLPGRSTVMATELESSDLVEEIKPVTSEESLKGLVNSVLSDVQISSSPVFSFRSSASVNNGVLNSNHSSLLFSAALVSKNLDEVLTSQDTNKNTCFGSPVSSTQPIFSTLTAFQLAASGSTSANSTPLADDKPGFQNTEAKPVKESIFSFTNTNSTAVPTNFPRNASSSSVAGSGSNSSNLLASSILSNTASGSSGLAEVAFFPRSRASLVTASSPLFLSMSSNIFGSSSHLQSSSSSFSFTVSTMKPVFNLPPESSSGGVLNPSQSNSQQISFSSASSFGLEGSPSGFGSSSFGSSTPSAKPFGLDSEFSFSAGTSGASAASGNSSFSAGFAPASSSPFPLFGNPAHSASGGGIFAFGSSAPDFSMPTSVGSSSASLFSSSQSAFGMSPEVGLFSGSGIPRNDQMSADDSMTDDMAPSATASVFSNFGQSPSHATPSFIFGSSTASPGGMPVFHFNGQQIPPVPQNPNPFHPSGVTSGGSFSLGSGVGDKSTRRMVKVRRDKLRKK